MWSYHSEVLAVSGRDWEVVDISPNKEENLMNSGGLTSYLSWGFIVLSSLPFMKHLVAFFQRRWPLLASLHVSKESPLCSFYSFRERH